MAMFCGKTVAKAVIAASVGNVRVADQPALSPLETQVWSSALTDCLTGECACFDCVNVRALLCPCLQIALNRNHLDGNVTSSQNDQFCCFCGLPPGLDLTDLCLSCPNVEYYNRARLRKINNIAGDPCTDCCLTLLCFHLSLCQNAREIRSRNAFISKYNAMQLQSQPPLVGVSDVGQTNAGAIYPTPPQQQMQQYAPQQQQQYPPQQQIQQQQYPPPPYEEQQYQQQPLMPPPTNPSYEQQHQQQPYGNPPPKQQRGGIGVTGMLKGFQVRKMGK